MLHLNFIKFLKIPISF